MATTFTDKIKFRKPGIGDKGWGDELHDNTEILEVSLASMLHGNGVAAGLAPSDGGSLDVDYAAGSVVVNGSRKPISAGSKTCAASQKNWLYVDSSGAIQISTTAPTGQYVPIAMIDAGAASITRIADLRSLPRTQAMIAETLTGTRSLAAGDICTHQMLDPGGANRDVRLPPEAQGWITIYNAADAAETLTIKDESGTSTIGVVPQGGAATFLCNGTTWVVHEMRRFAGDVEFAGSVSTGTIKEATGTNTGVTLNSDGSVTLPNQPGALVTSGVTQSNVTGDGTTVTVAVSTERFDQGGDFAANVFTAPVDGKYAGAGAIYLTGLTSNHTSCTIDLVTSNNTYHRIYKGNPYASGGAERGINVAWPPVDMDASDTAYLQITVSSTDKTVDIYNGYTFWGMWKAL